jgi:hypothetical protein
VATACGSHIARGKQNQGKVANSFTLPSHVPNAHQVKAVLNWVGAMRLLASSLDEEQSEELLLARKMVEACVKYCDELRACKKG